LFLALLHERLYGSTRIHQPWLGSTEWYLDHYLNSLDERWVNCPHRVDTKSTEGAALVNRSFSKARDRSPRRRSTARRAKVGSASHTPRICFDESAQSVGKVASCRPRHNANNRDLSPNEPSPSALLSLWATIGEKMRIAPEELG